MIKPILFNTEMVQAISDGRKTVTRRVVKPQPPDVPSVKFREIRNGNAVFEWDCSTNLCERKAKYNVGDILWVRETWEYLNYAGENNGYVYRASENGQLWENASTDWTWHPSIHMPKEAARLFLRVTGVRVERLQDITSEQMLSEGIDVKFPEPKPSYISLAYTEIKLKPAIKKDFSELWDKTIKPADLLLYGWSANPWVWVIEFEWCEKPDNWMMEAGEG